jgi:NCS1 family nucleobase:cation symporter-1
VASLDDTDISWIIGLVVPAVLYYVAAKRWPGNVADRLILPPEPNTTHAGRTGAPEHTAVN